MVAQLVGSSNWEIPECVGATLRSSRMDRDLPEREPPLHVGLNRQIRAHDRLQREFPLVVASLVSRWDEWVEGAALVEIDPVDHRVVGSVGEWVEGAEELRRKPVIFEATVDGVRCGHNGLEVLPVNDHPAVAEGVRRYGYLDVVHLLEDILEL